MACCHVPEKPPQEGFDAVPGDEDPDVIVLNVLEGDGRAVQVNETEDVDYQAIHGQALGAKAGVQSLGRQDTLQWSVGEGENDVEKEIEGKRGFGQ